MYTDGDHGHGCMSGVCSASDVRDLKHNFSHSYQAEAQCTWSKSMENGSSPYSFSLVAILPMCSNFDEQKCIGA
jgi:hypothetical protein